MSQETHHSGARISRRSALLLATAGTAGIAIAPVERSFAQTSDAAPAGGAVDDRDFAPGWRHYTIGNARLTCLLDGVAIADDFDPIFGPDQDREAMRELMRANALPDDRFGSCFMPVAVEIGDQLVVVDAGFGASGRANGTGLMPERLEASGYRREDVDLVLFTHLHGDHILGVSDDGVPVFPNASYALGRVEMNYWETEASGDRAELVARLFGPLRDRTRLLDGGEEVMPGLTARATFGHTPGMLAFELDGGNDQRLLITGDVFHSPVASFQRPEWRVPFDEDHEAAVATRRRVAQQLAETGMPFTAYHLPFPGVGYVQRDGDNYRFVPESYQLALNRR
ncbi:MBL fold metallo-hydrolase [Agrobacterium sp. NPDC090283]|uniref:MBL fold metallo-hydrolase n=1 Tax=Agrobacterium sp. NPDC090283 TaxID=3363920 RepID=UPI00383BBC96